MWKGKSLGFYGLFTYISAENDVCLLVCIHTTGAGKYTHFIYYYTFILYVTNYSHFRDHVRDCKLTWKRRVHVSVRFHLLRVSGLVTLSKKKNRLPSTGRPTVRPSTGWSFRSSLHPPTPKSQFDLHPYTSIIRAEYESEAGSPGTIRSNTRNTAFAPGPSELKSGELKPQSVRTKGP